jgi:hypothetical protein
MSDTGKSWEEMTPDDRATFLAVLGKDLPRTNDEWLDYAASLSAIDYDQKRDAIAKRLDIRVSTLDTEIERRKPKTESNDTQEGRSILLSDPALKPQQTVHF